MLCARPSCLRPAPELDVCLRVPLPKTVRERARARAHAIATARLPRRRRGPAVDAASSPPRGAVPVLLGVRFVLLHRLIRVSAAEHGQLAGSRSNRLSHR